MTLSESAEGLVDKAGDGNVFGFYFGHGVEAFSCMGVIVESVRFLLFLFFFVVRLLLRLIFLPEYTALVVVFVFGSVLVLEYV